MSVCDGLTRGYNLLLKTEGIDCSEMHTEDHMWTGVTLDGVFYYVDVTNGDVLQDGAFDDFCVTPEEMREYAREYPFMGILLDMMYGLGF